MKYRAFLVAAACAVLHTAHGAEAAVPLRSAPVSFDRGHLLAGAQLFVHYCQGCHTLKYLRYSHAGDDLGLSQAEVKDLLMVPANAQYYGTMTNTLQPAEAAAWLGVAPPDLTLEGRYRGADWIYTYLTGFYLDPSAAQGWNNRLFPHVAMPNVLAPLGGVRDARGDLIAPGTMSQRRFEAAVADLTSWLAYTSDPSRLQRRSLGWWVLPFLLLLTALAYALKRSYWRDVH